MINKLLAFNRRYVQNKEYERHITDKSPGKNLAILTCMDTRLTVMLPEALGLKNGDAKIIKNAGGQIPTDTDSAIRSLLVAIVNHSLVPKDVTVRGYIIDSVTGELTEVKDR